MVANSEVSYPAASIVATERILCCMLHKTIISALVVRPESRIFEVGGPISMLKPTTSLEVVLISSLLTECWATELRQ